MDFNGNNLNQVTEVLVPRFQAMHLIKGDLSDIETEINRLAPLYDKNKPAWLDIEVSTEDYLQDLQQRIHSFVKGLPLEVLLLRRSRTNRQVGLSQLTKETLHELTVQEAVSYTHLTLPTKA